MKKETNETTTTSEQVGSFQVHYFPVSKREAFKEWAHDKGIGIKELLCKIVDNREEINLLLLDKEIKGK